MLWWAQIGAGLKEVVVYILTTTTTGVGVGSAPGVGSCLEPSVFSHLTPAHNHHIRAGFHPVCKQQVVL
jgi:hypothetical protein